MLFGDVDGSAAQSFAKISNRITALSEQMFAAADLDGVSPRDAAFAMASTRLDEITRRFGNG